MNDYKQALTLVNTAKKKEERRHRVKNKNSARIMLMIKSHHLLREVAFDCSWMILRLLLYSSLYEPMAILNLFFSSIRRHQATL